MNLRRLSLVALSLLLASGGVRAAELHPAEETRIEPGGSAVVPLFLSGTKSLTLGSFEVAFSSKETLPLPTLSAVEPGEALSRAAAGCDPCRSLSAFPLRSRIEAGSAARVLFSLPSGPSVRPEDGINGDGQEIVRVRVSIPESIPAGASYEVSITETDFSDAGSRAVPMTAKAGRILIVPSISLKEGANTAYHEEGRPGHLLIPTSGDDPATPAMEPGFPNDGRPFGNRSYKFRVEATGQGTTPLSWSVSATGLDGSPVPESWAGNVESGNADGTVGLYTPAEASMKIASALRVFLTVRSALLPDKSLTIEAILLPYGDADLDGRVTTADQDLAFRWANGLDLPLGPTSVESPSLNGYQPSPLRRLLTDVRGVPGVGLNEEVLGQWQGELERLHFALPALADHDRSGFPFGDGRISHADVQWIARKATLNALTPAETLDPRIHGVHSASF